MQPSNQPPVKKTYHRPQLTQYGKVRELTRGGPRGRSSDGGMVVLRNLS
jgi:hypothetical protein